MGLTADASGNLFGATSLGGTGNYGTVFEIPAGSNTVTTIASFNYTNGANPSSGVTLDAADDIFGTATNGGAGGSGAVFEIAAGSSTITTLASFAGTNGRNPQAAVTLDSSGDLFGTAFAGGAYNNYGTVWEIAKGTRAITVIHSFNGTDGLGLSSPLSIDGAGNLYGTTQGGGGGAGTVFEIPDGSTTLTTLASFNNGGDPLTAAIVDAAGNIFGSTSKYGTNGAGTLFEISRGSGTVTNLVSFSCWRSRRHAKLSCAGSRRKSRCGDRHRQHMGHWRTG